MKKLTCVGYLFLFGAFCSVLLGLQVKNCCTDYVVSTTRPWLIASSLEVQYLNQINIDYPGAAATGEALGVVLDDMANIWDNCHGTGLQYEEHLTAILSFNQRILIALEGDEDITELLAEIEHEAIRFATFLSQSNHLLDPEQTEKLVLNWVNAAVKGITLLTEGEFSLSVRAFNSYLRRASELGAYIATYNCKAGCALKIDIACGKPVCQKF